MYNIDKISRKSFPEKQKTIDILSDGKGIRLDVYVDDENGTVYNRDILLKDEAIKVFINADGDLTGLPDDLAAFLLYLKGKVVENELIRMIDNEVEKVKKHQEWEVEYMTLYLRDMENRDEGIEIGMERGLKQGREEGREEGLSALVNSLQPYIADVEELYRTVIKNEAYKDTPREDVIKYLK